MYFILFYNRFKEGKELYHGRKYDTFFWDNKASLIVKDTTPTDTGAYRCEIHSPLGRIDSTGALCVYSK